MALTWVLKALDLRERHRCTHSLLLGTPAPLNVVPGQLITIFVSGIGSGITQRITATSFPLPRQLGGVSVSLTQLSGPQTPPVPLLAVFPVNGCANFTGCSQFLGITLQVPFELNPNIPGTFLPPNAAQITASDGVNTASGLQPNPVTNQIHVLRYGDTVVTGPGLLGPVVKHLDGKLVSSDNPASVGEVLVIYAVGLGRTDVTVKSGDASPLQPVGFKVPLIFDSRPNATPSTMLIGSQQSGSQGFVIQGQSLFAGLTPGYAGLYQINFQVPAPPGLMAACGNGIATNLTVDVIGSTGFMSNSFDGTGICVSTK